MRTFLTFIAATTLLALTACDNPQAAKAYNAPQEGTRILIKQHRYELIGEVVYTKANLIGIDYYWHGERAYSQKLYRGLLPIWTKERGTEKEMDLDTALLDRLFPLKSGNETSFTAVLTNTTNGDSEDISMTYQVKEETVLTLNGEEVTVFLIDITRQKDGRIVSLETVYYAPKYGLALKAIQKAKKGKSFWRVLDIQAPTGQAKPSLQNKNRRSGTIAI